ncbi:MAG: mechanosensitive ion channel family protein, partial [Vicinamibacteraceae bacterium]|nr:mechanosensitive ion channel family protein [Vicinamibacteraceae bacterium]
MHDAASIHLWLGLGLLALALAVQAFTLNRLVRRKLRLTLALAALSLLVGAAERSGLIPADIAPGLRSLGNLLVALALANFLVVVLLNPLRADRVPAHLPSIVQDAIVVLLFLVVATILLRETLLLTSAVGAVVVGFALQDTLGNAFAGLALQTEKPFKVGQWVRIGDHEGRVEELTWRATKLRTRQST